jgi:hypothetical protein
MRLACGASKKKNSQSRSSGERDRVLRDGHFFSPLEPSSCLEFQGSGANQSPVTRCPRSPPSARAPLTLFRRTNHAVFDQFSCRFVFFSQLYTGVSLTHLHVRSSELSLPKQKSFIGGFVLVETSSATTSNAANVGLSPDCPISLRQVSLFSSIVAVHTNSYTLHPSFPSQRKMG